MQVLYKHLHLLALPNKEEWNEMEERTVFSSGLFHFFFSSKWVTAGYYSQNTFWRRSIRLLNYFPSKWLKILRNRHTKKPLEIFSWNIAWKKHRSEILFAAFFYNPMHKVKNNIMSKEAFPLVYIALLLKYLIVYLSATWLLPSHWWCLSTRDDKNVVCPHFMS